MYGDLSPFVLISKRCTQLIVLARPVKPQSLLQSSHTLSTPQYNKGVTSVLRTRFVDVTTRLAMEKYCMLYFSPNQPLQKFILLKCPILFKNVNLV